MIPVIPWYITAVVLAANLAAALAAWSVVSSGVSQANLSPETGRAVRSGAAVFLGGWLAAALLLAPAPRSLLAHDPFYLTPIIPLFALLGAASAALALWLSPAVRRTLTAAPLPAVIGIQLYRAVGLVFVILLAQGQLPAHFALPAGWGDVAIGLSAPLVALALARGLRGGRGLAIAWNALGLLDLAVAVGMGTGFLAPVLMPAQGPVPPAAAMGVFPMILVPIYAVPISVLLHLLALTRLLREIRLGSRLAPTPS